MSEIWRPCGGNYEVSDLGNVRNPHKVLKKSVKRNGYEFVGLILDGKVTLKYVHRLVWEAFNGKVPTGFEINHRDENKLNNSLSNLELVTHKQNMNHGTQSERANMTKRHNNTLGLGKKQVAQVSPDFKLIKIHSSLKEASISTGAFVSNISMCCKRKDKTAKGFHWVIIPPDCQDVKSFIQSHFE